MPTRPKKNQRRLTRPQDMRTTCRECAESGYMPDGCNMRHGGDGWGEGPWINIADRGENPGSASFCEFRRCGDGYVFAQRRLDRAVRSGKWETKKTPDGKNVRGVDCSLRKHGFVDDGGNFYIYAQHEKGADVVIPTGQRLPGWEGPPE